MPLFQKPYKNLESDAPLNGGALKREIAARTHVSEAVVDLVIDTLKEVVTEEVVNKGSFNLSGLFVVKNFPTKETVTPKGVIPARNRLSIRLNDRVKKLWNSKQKSGDPENKSYKELLEDHNNATRSADQIAGPSSNPMLEDDDEF